MKTGSYASKIYHLKKKSRKFVEEMYDKYDRDTSSQNDEKKIIIGEVKE